MCLTARSEDALYATAERCLRAGAAGVYVRPCNLGNPAEVGPLAGGRRGMQHGDPQAPGDCRRRLERWPGGCRTATAPPPPLQVDRLGAALLAAHGCINVLVNCAGAYPEPGRIDFLEGDPDAWDEAFA